MEYNTPSTARYSDSFGSAFFSASTIPLPASFITFHGVCYDKGSGCRAADNDHFRWLPNNGKVTPHDHEAAQHAAQRDHESQNNRHNALLAQDFSYLAQLARALLRNGERHRSSFNVWIRFGVPVRAGRKVRSGRASDVSAVHVSGLPRERQPGGNSDTGHQPERTRVLNSWLA